ncbi:MAG TPA: nitrile hydratase subunit alpha [Chloroflexota bacterium]|jgi:nitrile hydratase|nr:nitrile hydratase subunit alpha [Chloroflexota bacterium]HZU06084.1 nitrile hydratase subunit alpha [Chloroflexota bacterium]
MSDSHAHSHQQAQAPGPAIGDLLAPPIDWSDHPLTYYEKRIIAIGNLLREKGILTVDEIRRATEELEARTPALGARVVARAWVDPAYKARLLANAKAAVEELGIPTDTINHLVVPENTDKVHHVVVCTLCSCYPRQLLGEPPDWYKSDAYKIRIIQDPRSVLRERGVHLAEDVEVRVLDSTADVRYLVLPRRPPGTEGWSEEQLATLVTRDAMIGVAEALSPTSR